MTTKRPQRRKPSTKKALTPSDKRRRVKRWTGSSDLAGAFMLAFFIVASAGIYTYYGRQFEPPDEFAINAPAGGAKVLDRNGNLLYQFIDDRDGLRVPMKIGDINDNLLAATISTEDETFY